MRRGERGEVDRLELLEPAARVKQSDCIAGHQTSQGVPDHAELLDLFPGFLQFFQVNLDFMRDSFPSKVNAVCDNYQLETFAEIRIDHNSPLEESFWSVPYV